MRRDGTFDEFLAHPEVDERLALRSRVGLMAFHAGLEEGTGEIAAEAAAASGASLYVAEQPPDLQWHVSSHKVTPESSPAVAEFLDHVDVVLALHGYGRPHLRRSVLLGGRDRDTAESVAVELVRRFRGVEVLTDLERIPKELRGQHRTNPVNVAAAGVQIELPPIVRMRLPDWASHHQPVADATRVALVEGLAASVARLDAPALERPAGVVAS